MGKGSRFVSLAVLAAMLAACAGAPANRHRANRAMPPGWLVGAQSPAWDEPARFASGDSPIYPANQFLTGGEGRAAIEFTVAEDGTTRDITVTQASLPVYGRHLAAAAKNWRFEPARKDGRPVASPLSVDFEFSIERNFDVPPSPRQREQMKRDEASRE